MENLNNEILKILNDNLESMDNVIGKKIYWVSENFYNKKLKISEMKIKSYTVALINYNQETNDVKIFFNLSDNVKSISTEFTKYYLSYDDCKNKLFEKKCQNDIQIQNQIKSMKEKIKALEKTRVEECQ